MDKEKQNWMNIPNLLTFIRLLMVPVFVWAYYEYADQRWIALVIFGLASFTDCLDGYLARKWNQITSFGKLFDPLADKLMVLAMLCCLAADGRLAMGDQSILNWVVVIIVIVKELFMICGAIYMLSQNIVVKSNYLGKVATVTFILGILLVFPWHGNEVIYSIGRLVVYLAVAISIAAMIGYALESAQKLVNHKKPD